MNSTKHFNLRWTERVTRIKGEKEVKEYISKNKEMINEHANKTFEYATFIYKGSIGDNQTRNYYVKDDMVFVTNTTDDAFITIFLVDLGFTDELNMTVRKGLIEEIQRLSDEKEVIEAEIINEIDDKESEVLAMEGEIEVLSQQLANLKERKNFLKGTVNNIEKKSLHTELELKRYTMMLVNSKEYRNDLTSLK